MAPPSVFRRVAAVAAAWVSVCVVLGLAGTAAPLPSNVPPPTDAETRHACVFVCAVAAAAVLAMRRPRVFACGLLLAASFVVAAVHPSERPRPPFPHPTTSHPTPRRAANAADVAAALATVEAAARAFASDGWRRRAQPLVAMAVDRLVAWARDDPHYFDAAAVAVPSPTASALTEWGTTRLHLALRSARTDTWVSFDALGPGAPYAWPPATEDRGTLWLVAAAVDAYWVTGCRAVGLQCAVAEVL